MKAEAGEILGMKTEILNRMKKIYSRKFNSLKIRNHGDFISGRCCLQEKIFILLILKENLHDHSVNGD
jgi:maltose alpha-D-glucosyltransferase / alpha-amylase